MIPIKTAVCSFGMSGKTFQAPFLHVLPQFEFYSVWERSKNLAAELYPSVRTCRTYEELLGDPAVELVIVNTPNYTHYEYAKAALSAGKHVIVEKPFTVTFAEAEELIALAASKGVQLSSYQSRRFDSDFRTVRRVVESGVLGKIVEAEIHYDRFTPALSPKVHKETAGPGRGLLYDLGSHLIDQVLQLWGMPEAVFADLFIIRDNSQVDDYMEVLLYYPGLRVRLKSSYLVREPLPAYSVFGHKGTFLKTRADVQEKHLLAGEMPEGENWGVEPDSERGLLVVSGDDGSVSRERVVSERGDARDYFKGVAGAIRNGAPLPVTAEQGAQVVKVIEKAYESLREKKVIAI
ncbi:MAG: Gfo/Idh/MocA family oxidoreductase [Bacteroidetes bacterium]|nr:Gfo/Idh/MocA family oxidoreductase [Bacteroidota bacterium]